MPGFIEGELVRLKDGNDRAEPDDPDVGTVCGLYVSNPPAYEVRFMGNDGIEFDVLMFEDELESASGTGTSDASAADPSHVTGR